MPKLAPNKLVDPSTQGRARPAAARESADQAPPNAEAEAGSGVGFSLLLFGKTFQNVFVESISNSENPGGTQI